MPQALLPLVAEDATRISDLISVVRQGGQWFYFCGTQPVFQHAEGDLRSFRMFTAQLCVQGACKQADIIRAFGVSKSSVLRSVKKYRQEGIQGFYRTRRTRGAPVMTPHVIKEAQQLFQEGYSRAEVARELELRPGDSIISSPENAFDLAGVYPLKMKVTGILEKSHTSDDLAVFVDLKTAWVIQGLGHGHERAARDPDGDRAV